LMLRLADAPDPEMQSTLAQAYAAIAARQDDEADVKGAVFAVRMRLMQATGVIANSSRFARAYALLVAQLRNMPDVRAEASILRTEVEQAPSVFVVARLGEAYAAVASRLADEADVRAAANTLRSALERGRDDGSARALAIAYGIVARAMMGRADPKERPELVREILTLASHPFVSSKAEASLLAALQVTAGVDFGSDVGAAVQWAEHTYGITPDQLRPSPLQQ
jgi:hypothetical protein